MSCFHVPVKRGRVGDARWLHGCVLLCDHHSAHAWEASWRWNILNPAIQYGVVIFINLVATALNTRGKHSVPWGCCVCPPWPTGTEFQHSLFLFKPGALMSPKHLKSHPDRGQIAPISLMSPTHVLEQWVSRCSSFNGWWKCFFFFLRFVGHPGKYNKLFDRWRLEEVSGHGGAREEGVLVEKSSLGPQKTQLHLFLKMMMSEKNKLWNSESSFFKPFCPFLPLTA